MKGKKEAKRDLILQEAAKLFKQKGFGGTSMRDLAEQVGIDAASMYHYIKSKDEILKTICFKIASIYLSQMDEILQTQNSYASKLKALVRLHIQIMFTNGAEVSVANNDWKYLTPDNLKEFKELRSRYEKRLANLIQEGVEAGELVEVNTSVTLFTILSAVRWVELWWRPERGVMQEELENSILTILFQGLDNNAR